MSFGKRIDKALDAGEKITADAPSMVLFYILLVSGLCILSGCVGPAPAPVASSCGTPAMAIIHPSPADTDLTLAQIDLHNKSVRSQCPETNAPQP